MGRCRTQPLGGACLFGTEPACGCSESVVGTACVECSGLGYIQGTTCVCAAPHDNQDPNNAQGPCLPVTPVTQQLDPLVNAVEVSCACWNTTQLGCFRATNTLGEYGYDPNPQTCGACCNDGFGPQPGTVDDTLAGDVASGICTSYGAPDPEAINTTLAGAWVQCAGHGDWHDVGCYPYDGWELAPTGQPGFFGQEQYVPLKCAPFWGPWVSSQTPSPYCVVGVYAPEPLNGTLMECSGHGAWLGTQKGCACYQSPTAGYWNLTSITQEVNAPENGPSHPGLVVFTNRNVTVQTCAVCSDASLSVFMNCVP